MDKKTFDVVEEYSKMIAALYFELDDLGIPMEKLDQLLEKFDSFQAKTYEIGLHENKEKILNKKAILTKNYQEWPSYLRLLVHYEYDNGFSLCETTAGNMCLIPTNFISYDVEVRGGWQNKISET